ncbi:MAG: Crp/Fnr family transcriptional regulator [Candidatus Binatia bacterium]
MVASAQSQEIRVPKGSMIFRQGDPGNEMFVISQGRVRLTIGTAGHEKEVAVFGPGDFFGELSLLSDEPRSATAEAVEDATLLAIGRDAFAMMVQDDLDIVFRMMNIQGQRLSRTNEPIQDLMQRLGRVRIAVECLRRMWALTTAWPASLDVADLSTAAGLSRQAVAATIAELAQQGIGSLQDGRWSIPDRTQAGRLLDVLCQLAGKGGN